MIIPTIKRMAFDFWQCIVLPAGIILGALIALLCMAAPLLAFAPQFTPPLAAIVIGALLWLGALWFGLALWFDNARDRVRNEQRREALKERT